MQEAAAICSLHHTDKTFTVLKGNGNVVLLCKNVIDSVEHFCYHFVTSTCDVSRVVLSGGPLTHRHRCVYFFQFDRVNTMSVLSFSVVFDSVSPVVIKIEVKSLIDIMLYLLR